MALVKEHQSTEPSAAIQGSQSEGDRIGESTRDTGLLLLPKLRNDPARFICTDSVQRKVMATKSVPHDSERVEEEFVLLDLNAVSEQVDIQPNAPYVLSGLDTMNPTLIINNKLKLVGEYVETIGTCLVFSESDATPVVHMETGPSEANLFSGAGIIDPNQASSKQVKPVAQLQKILKFRLAEEVDCKDSTADGNAVVNEMDGHSTRTTILYDHVQGTS